MSESHWSRGELIERICSLEVWQRASGRAPHQPLSMLLALARLARGATRLATFEQLEEPWNQPLKEFGPRRAHSSTTLVPKHEVVENLCRRRGMRAA